jgi:hypothetical protein
MRDVLAMRVAMGIGTVRPNVWSGRPMSPNGMDSFTELVKISGCLRNAVSLDYAKLRFHFGLQLQGRNIGASAAWRARVSASQSPLQ